MTTSRRILITAVLCVAVAAAITALASAGSKPAVRPAFVTSHGLRARSVTGSFCAPSNGAVLCADAAYPLHPRAYLPITPSSRVLVNLRRRASHVEARLIDAQGQDAALVGPKLAVQARGANGRLWRVRLPKDLGGADALSINADLEPSGDANWWAGVRPVERWP
jgi:hypothetical protein